MLPEKSSRKGLFRTLWSHVPGPPLALLLVTFCVYLQGQSKVCDACDKQTLHIKPVPLLKQCKGSFVGVELS